MYPYIHTCNPSFVRAAVPTHADARACAGPLVCAHTHARIGGPAAHNGMRRIEHPAERVPPAVARCPARGERAYVLQRGDRGGVPRADVCVERRRRKEGLRAEPPAVDAGKKGSQVSVQTRGRPCARAHTRDAHGRSPWARVGGGQHIGDPFVGVARRACI